MIYRPIGRSGITASVVAHGTCTIADAQTPVRAIQASLDAGVNFIDTAPAYGLGLSEQIVGEAIQGRRDKVIVATKCGLVWHANKGAFFTNQDGAAINCYLGAESIRYEVEESLRRLRTDYIDLYQTHWQDAATPVEETMAALLDLKREGKIRAIGVSNCTVDQLRKYRAVGPVDAVRETYSMTRREIERDYLPYCRQNQIAVLACSVASAANDFSRLRPIAQKYNLTEGRLAIAWVLAQPGITHALVGARDPRQAEENAAAGGVLLSADDLQVVTEEAQRMTLVDV
ncbi:MAG TPA: aldo/keto reductase [Bryobacteraceae bacterium]|nr:aldo/keto reductase [Bryobacteraceae bacterium]